MLIFAPQATRELGAAVARALGAELAPLDEREFEGGEHKARPLTPVRGRDLYLVQSLHGGPEASPDDKLCRLLFLAGAVRDAGAGRVTAVIPYLAYARKDRRTQQRPRRHEGNARCVNAMTLALKRLSAMAYLFLVLALALNAAANILLKIGATRLGGLAEPGLTLRLASNYHLAAGLLLFALNVVFYIAALTRLDLSVAYPIMVAGGIVIVVAGSVFALQEVITPLQTLGLALLVLGIALVGHRSLA